MAKVNISRSLLVLLFCFVTASALAVPRGPIVGTMTSVLGDVSGIDQDGDVFEVTAGAPVYAGYTFETGSRAFVRAEMRDGTRLTLGRNGQATIEQFAYNPTAQTGQFNARIQRGGFRYTSGGIGKFSGQREHTQISTPSAVIGVRGSTANGEVGEDGSTKLENESGIFSVRSNNGQTTNLQAGNGVQVDGQGVMETFETLPPGFQEGLEASLPSEEEEAEAVTVTATTTETDDTGTDDTNTDDTGTDDTNTDDTGTDDTNTDDTDANAADPASQPTTGEGAAGDGAAGSAGAGGGGASDINGSPSGAAPSS